MSSSAPGSKNKRKAHARRLDPESELGHTGSSGWFEESLYFALSCLQSVPEHAAVAASAAFETGGGIASSAFSTGGEIMETALTVAGTAAEGCADVAGACMDVAGEVLGGIADWF